DLESISTDEIPTTVYKPIGDRDRYDTDYTSWQFQDAEDAPNLRSARDYYRVSWRAMAANTGERTLITAIYPPGTAHINGVFSVANPTGTRSEIGALAGITSSLIADYTVRTAPKSGIYPQYFMRH